MIANGSFLAQDMGDWSMVALKMLYVFVHFIGSPLKVSGDSFGTDFWKHADIALVEHWFELSIFKSRRLSKLLLVALQCFRENSLRSGPSEGLREN